MGGVHDGLRPGRTVRLERACGVAGEQRDGSGAGGRAGGGDAEHAGHGRVAELADVEQIKRERGGGAARGAVPDGQRGPDGVYGEFELVRAQEGVGWLSSLEIDAPDGIGIRGVVCFTSRGRGVMALVSAYEVQDRVGDLGAIAIQRSLRFEWDVSSLGPCLEIADLRLAELIEKAAECFVF